MRRNVIAMTEPKSLNSEQYRTIRTNIEFASVNAANEISHDYIGLSGGRKINNGRQSGCRIRPAGKKVLLIDADLRKPTVHTAFFLENTVGLTSVLLKKALWSRLYKHRMKNILTC